MTANAIPEQPTPRRKAELRREMRARRRALSDEERAHHARRMSRALEVLRLFRNSRRIALFWPNDGEIDPLALMPAAETMRKQVYLPVLAGFGGRGLWFVRYRAGEPMATNRYGIPEPRVRPGRRINPRFLDLVLTPLVAFDARGNRLGMGGGFYDRTFEFLRHRRHWHRPRLIGVAYEFQRVDGLPREPWDVPLAGVATEAGFYGFGRRTED